MLKRFFNLNNDNENFCKECLWYYKSENMCLHMKKDNDSPLFHNKYFCEYLFDLKLNRDYDKQSVEYFEKEIPNMVHIDDYGNKYVQG